MFYAPFHIKQREEYNKQQLDTTVAPSISNSLTVTFLKTKRLYLRPNGSKFTLYYAGQNDAVFPPKKMW